MCLISSVQQNDSVMFVPFSYSFPLWYITSYYVIVAYNYCVINIYSGPYYYVIYIYCIIYIQSPGTDCSCWFSSVYRLVGKTTRPFRYDLNQIPYDYTVEVTNRFKGFDLIECLKNCGCKFITLYRKQGSKPSQRKRNTGRQNGCLRRPYK